MGGQAASAGLSSLGNLPLWVAAQEDTCSRRRPETKSCHKGTFYTSGCVEGASPKSLHPHHSIYMYDSLKKGQKSGQWSPGARIGELEETHGNVG